MPVFSRSGQQETDRIERLARVVDSEFREMPGMRLTEAQVRRLWNLSPDECGAVLEFLLDLGQLECDPSGRYRGRPLAD
jgi:hypothetical protein